MPSKLLDEALALEVLALSRGGLSGRGIAVRLGVSPASVCRWLPVGMQIELDRVYQDGRSVGPYLCLSDRVKIRVGIARGLADSEIAEGLGCHRSTVWREIGCNGGRDGYDAVVADDAARVRAGRPRLRWFETNPVLWDEVRDLLSRWWSPEQIAGWLRVVHSDEPSWWVCHESIYQAIYVQTKPELRKHLSSCLRTGRIKRRPQRGDRAKNSPIADMVMVSERPPEVEDRAVPGHWEGDLIIGKANGSQVATLVERSTRFGILVRLDSKDSVHVGERMSEVLNALPEHLAKSLTWDQGTELADHANIKIATGVPVFFCEPHSPWQRGSNENWNGLVRQYLPKGTDLSKHSQQDLDDIALSLNTRPRKTLGWQTPAQQFDALVATAT